MVATRVKVTTYELCRVLLTQRRQATGAKLVAIGCRSTATAIMGGVDTIHGSCRLEPTATFGNWGRNSFDNHLLEAKGPSLTAEGGLDPGAIPGSSTWENHNDPRRR